MVLLGFYWVLPGFTGFYWFFTGFYRVLLGLTEFNFVLLVFTGFCRFLFNFTGFYLVLLFNFQFLREKKQMLNSSTSSNGGGAKKATPGVATASRLLPPGTLVFQARSKMSRSVPWKSFWNEKCRLACVP